MRSGATPDMAPKELAQHQVVRLHQLLHEARFADPDGAHLSPAGTICSLWLHSLAPCLQCIRLLLALIHAGHLQRQEGVRPCRRV